MCECQPVPDRLCMSAGKFTSEINRDKQQCTLSLYDFDSLSLHKFDFQPNTRTLRDKPPPIAHAGLLHAKQEFESHSEHSCLKKNW